MNDSVDLVIVIVVVSTACLIGCLSCIYYIVILKNTKPIQDKVDDKRQNARMTDIGSNIDEKHPKSDLDLEEKVNEIVINDKHIVDGGNAVARLKICWMILKENQRKSGFLIVQLQCHQKEISQFNASCSSSNVNS